MHFEIECDGEEFTFKRTDVNNEIWHENDLISFPVYNKSKEEVTKFGSFYIYLGVIDDIAPIETVNAIIHQCTNMV